MPRTEALSNSPNGFARNDNCPTSDFPLFQKHEYLGQIAPAFREETHRLMRNLETSNPLSLPIIDAMCLSGRSDLNSVAADLEEAGFDSQSNLFSSPDIVRLTEIFLLSNRHVFRRPLGILLSQIPLSAISAVVPQSGIERANTGLSIQLEHEDWFLCQEAEPNLNIALKRRLYTIINGALFVKHEGALAAVCFQSQSTEDGGSFIEGNWYCPTDKKTRGILKRIAGENDYERNIDLDLGSWVLVRELMDNQSTGMSSLQTLQRVQRLA